MGAEKVGVRDEGTLDRIPRVEILGFVEWPDQGSGQQGKEKAINHPKPRAGVALYRPHATWYRRAQKGLVLFDLSLITTTSKGDEREPEGPTAVVVRGALGAFFHEIVGS